MITVATAENALKNIYLDTVINDINTKTNPFLSMIEKNAKVASGKDAKVSIRSGNSAVGVGTESGDLPTTTNEKLIVISVPLKNLYGTFQITDKALKTASLDPNAFASLLSGEMQNLVSAAQNNLTTMLYGNGKKLLCVFDKTALNEARTVITTNARYIGNFTTGLSVIVYTPSGTKVSTTGATVTVNTSAKTLTLSSALTANKADKYYVYAGIDDGTYMNGIDSVFEGSPYGIDLTANPDLAPYKFNEGSTTLEILNEDAVMDFMDNYEEHCQGNACDIILTHPVVKKAIFESLRDTRANIGAAELAGGFRGFTFNGIPLYSDIKCKGGTLYALNSSSFAMHQLCDWSWLSTDDGTILKQQSGKPTYSATLVKYAELICSKPFLQGKCSNYAANQWKA
ncbi:MAG: phage major capsid protein [Christensenellaceae bacterium]|nr:phage major capsid protein [Christensenellaceae bacterium]